MSPWKHPLVRRFVHGNVVAWLKCGLLWGRHDTLALIVGIFSLAWGSYLSLPWVTLNIPGRPLLLAMADIATDPVWAGVAIGLGIAMIGAAIYKAQHSIMATAFVGFLFWAFLFYLHVVFSPRSPHAPLYFVAALLAGGAHLRAALLCAQRDGEMDCE